MGRQRIARRLVLLPIAALVLLCGAVSTNAQLLDDFHKSDGIHNMPDLGQVSTNWCWAAAAANSLYWYGKHGYPEVFDDPTNPGPDQDLDDPNGATGAHRLVEEVARLAGIPFSNPIYKSNHLNAINRFLIDHDIQASVRPSDGFMVHDIASDPSLLFELYAGPTSDPFGDPVIGNLPPVEPEEVDPLVAVEVRDPTFDDMRRELGRSQDVLFWLCPENLDGICHVVTVEGWERDPDPNNPTGWKVFFADPWTPDPPTLPGPDNNTDPMRATFEMYDVLSVNPLRIDYGNQKRVYDMIFISPVPEPSTATMTFLALISVVVLQRGRRRAAPS